MEEFNKYIKIWQTCILKMNDSISKKDFDSADEWERKADEAYEKYKEDTNLEYKNESRNFGELHYMLENAIPLLFKKKPNVLKQCMKTIKEDKNLLSQFKFYSALSAYDSPLKEAGNKKVVIPTVFTASPAVLKEFNETEYAQRLKATGVITSYICPLMY